MKESKLLIGKIYFSTMNLEKFKEFIVWPALRCSNIKELILLSSIWLIKGKLESYVLKLLLIWKLIKLVKLDSFLLIKEEWIRLKIVLFWYSLIPDSNWLKYVYTDIFFIAKYLWKSLLNNGLLLISFFKVWLSDFKTSICKRACKLSIVRELSFSNEKVLVRLFFI